VSTQWKIEVKVPLGFLACFVPSRMQGRDLKLFSFWSKIRRDRLKFMSFAIFSECAYFHVASYPNALIFVCRLLVMRLFLFVVFS
jgi:hypothetical protein